MKIEAKVPEIGESITEVTLSSWLVENGSHVEMDQPICEFESDKATLEFPAEASGIVTYVAKEGDDLPIGATVCIIDTEGKSNASPESNPSKNQTAAVQEQKEEKITQEAKAVAQPASTNTYATGYPSPAAKKILDEKGVSPESVQGSGVDGRITKEDAIKVAVPSASKISTTSTPVAPKAPAQPVVPGSRNEHAEKMTRLRRTISRRLVEAKNSTAMLTTFNEVDMTRIIEIRKAYKDEFAKEHDVNLGFMSFFVKACTLALQKFPDINAYIDEDSIIYHDFQDISIAVSTPKGLVVPVIRNAETLGFAEIEKEVKRLAVLGRDGKLTLEDMDGGTFTITNGGVFGSLISTPILNQPQSAILGMHKIQERPMVINGEIKARPMMYLALSYDHRIVDGKEAVSYLVTVKDYLENPERMLLGI